MTDKERQILRAFVNDDTDFPEPIVKHIIGKALLDIDDRLLRLEQRAAEQDEIRREQPRLVTSEQLKALGNTPEAKAAVDPTGGGRSA